ncbi:hypothetical protein niasHT_007782 [Heterodera trifolii]|uniref:Uncharacterized protein n=1 Tax=Heterodera trifolii TaxID=157864 RepID=A0ABD2LKM2_9BILA
MSIKNLDSNRENEQQNLWNLRGNGANNLLMPGIFQRKTINSLMNRKLNIFRERWTNDGERKMDNPSEEYVEENLGEETARRMGERHWKKWENGEEEEEKSDRKKWEEEEEKGKKPGEEKEWKEPEKEEEKVKKLGEEEKSHRKKPGEEERVRFLEEPAASSPTEDSAGREKNLNPFEDTKFDERFPIHNLCGPWNSGRQTSDFEWGEPADKLLRLLNQRTTEGKKGRSNANFKYNMFLAPGQMTGESTNVSIAIYIESMSTFKAQTMDFEMDMYFAMAWYDRRLAHNCTHPLLVAHKSIAERIWTPDLYFLNAKFAYLQEVTMPNFMLVIYPDGLVFKTLRIDVTLSCNMDLQLFPFDRQECPMVIQPFAYIENLVNLSWHVDPPYYPITTNPELKLNDMVITGMRFERCTSPYTLFRGIGIWSCLRGYIVMKRLVLFHLIQTYIPSAMLVSVSWMTFWLDPRASPARITLTITSLLTLTTMSNGARQDLPQVSYIKAMDIWQTFSQALIFLVLLEYSFVSYFFSRRSFDCAHRILRSESAGKMTKQNEERITAEDEEKQMEEGDKEDHHYYYYHDQQNDGTKAMEMNNHAQAIRKRCQPKGTAVRPKSAVSATLPPKTEAFSSAEFGTASEGKRRLLCRMSNIREEIMTRMGRNHSEEGILMGLGIMEGEEGMTMPTRKGGGEGQEEEGTSARDRPNPGRGGRHCQQCQWEDERRGRAVDRYSRALFPTIFFSFCAAYWLYYGWLMAKK